MTNRSNPTRWYIDGGDLVGRQKDAPEERFAWKSLPDRLLIEGYVSLRTRGVEHDRIMRGEGVPDRALPSSGTARVTEESKWRECIAHAVAEEDTKAGFVGVSREAKEAALVEGRSYAAVLSKQDVRDHQNRQSVLKWYATLHGDKGPVRQRVPMQEAAD